MTIFYSTKNNSFYPSELKAEYEASVDGWPSDAFEISQSEYAELMKGRDSGQVILADGNGRPVLADPVIDWQGKAEYQRQNLLEEANDIIADWRIELQLDTISDNDKTSLIKCMAYIKNLKSLMFTDVIDKESYAMITWPDKPY
ncbi:tail fiber assembly protein [Erwinia tracheiphila]|uniref:Phage tail protein n=1 Tax=Erwinia tracheiphila TaxID=65700 RepID=A0A345CNV0_9GAMM|nr:tail fiber assembly protein [Erwinia tracheiphila]AXF75117.1 phage tail protein [Erwinia tracheiphila]UIA82335.1 tail fiber assembly protein [Erwinia tracheiphila]UIA90931.1 tail fiber assembly protein [Erwinia tracheiphila]